MNAEQQVVVAQKLPVIPLMMHPIVGAGVVEKRLMLRRGYPDAETAMVAFRDEHSPERQPYYRAYFTERTRDKSKVRVRYLWGREPRRTWVIGVTHNSSEAIRILIGNNLANCWMGSYIRWEFYEDRECENLLEMGRIDQWDLLKDITPTQLETLAEKGIRPTGKWNFDGLIWDRKCSLCGTEISLNAYLFNIDSAVCDQCGNRPFLAPSLHRWLDDEGQHPVSQPEKVTLHILEWMSHVGSTFGEVRKDAEDVNGKRIKSLAERSLIWQATDRDTASRVRALVEANTSINFEMYAGACALVRKAMAGEVEFKEEHRIAAEFVAKATELIRVRQLSTRG